MSERKLTEQKIEAFHQYLIREEKSTATVEKYLRDVRAFMVVRLAAHVSNGLKSRIRPVVGRI